MAKKDLGQIIPDIKAEATVDNASGIPAVEVTVEELTELNRLVRKFNFAFSNMKGEKGDKPEKGVDYYTEEEKEDFTNETTALVTSEGNKQIESIKSKGNEQVGLVSSEGNKVIEQIKSIVEGNAAESNALTLSGKTRTEFEKETQGVAGGYSGKFPLSSATLNGIYLLPETGKFYVCTKAYSGSQISVPNSNFEELSVFANRDRLDNLCIIWEEITRAEEPIHYYSKNDNMYFDLTKPFSFKNKNGRNYDFLYVDIDTDATWNKFTSTTSLKEMIDRNGRLSYFYALNGEVFCATILGIVDGATSLYGADNINPSEIIFYGGYLTYKK